MKRATTQVVTRAEMRPGLINNTPLASVVALVMALAQSAPKQLASYDPQVKALLARMTLEEKIGQMTQPEQDALKDPADHISEVGRCIQTLG